MVITKKSITHTLLTLFIMMTICPPAIASNRSSNIRLEFLVRFFDLNEAAFAYHRHCLSRKENINDTFLNTFDFVANELLDEVYKDDPGMNPEFIKTRIVERRYNIQFKLDNENMKNGCYTPNSKTAKDHYVEFSRYNTQEISKFIDEQSRK